MSEFDYRQHKIIGVARKKNHGNLHASVYPLGYQDNNFHFQHFSSINVKSLFKHKGTVFGFKFPESLVDKLVVLHIMKNDDVSDPNKDLFLIDYSASRIEEYAHTPIVNTDKQGLNVAIINKQFNSYYRIDNNIYYITKPDIDNGIVKFWQIEDALFEANNDLCKCDDEMYLIGEVINYEFNYIDILPNEGMIKYIISILNNYNVTAKDIVDISNDLLKKLDLPLNILKNRFNKFTQILKNVELTYEDISNLAVNPLFSDTILRNINKFKDEYVKSLEDYHVEAIKKLNESSEQELNKLKGAYENERKELTDIIKSINEEIGTKKLLLDDIISKINKKELEAKELDKRIIDIEKHKNRIIKDFTIIGDVIGHKPQNERPSFINNIESVRCDGIEFNGFDEFKRQIALFLALNGFSEDSSAELSKDLSRVFISKNYAGKNICVILLPNLLIFKALIEAIGQYKLRSVCVGVNWKSFDDLYFNTLQEMLESAKENPNEIHILLLQNMNLSYIPSYMQPINDLLIGITNKLPGQSGIEGLPANFWIIGTRTSSEEEAIAISRNNIEEFGCIKNKDYARVENIPNVIPNARFLTMDLICSQREEDLRFKGFPDSYLD